MGKECCIFFLVGYFENSFVFEHENRVKNDAQINNVGECLRVRLLPRPILPIQAPVLNSLRQVLDPDIL